MTRTRRLLGGVSLGYLYLGLVSVVGLWLTPFLLSHISTHDFGLWLVATQLLGYLQLTDFGLASVVPRDVALASGAAQREREGAPGLAATLSAYRRIVAGQMAVVIALSLGAWLLLPTGWEGLRAPLLILLVAFVGTFPLKLRQGTLQGLQDHAFISKLQIGSWVAGTGLTIVLVLAGVGLTSLAAGWALTQVLMLGGCALRVRHAFPHAWASTSRQSPVASHDLGRRVRQMGWVTLAQLGHILLNGTDMLILGALLGPSAVVAYACTGKLVTVFTNHPQLVIQTAVPALAELRMISGRDRLVDVIRALMAAMLLMSGGIITVILAVNASFVEWWVGESFFSGSSLTVAMVGAMLLRHLGAVLNLSLFPFGYERRLSLTALADGLLTLLVTAALVRFTPIGTLAAPIGSMAGAALITVPASLRALGRELQTGAAGLIAPMFGWSWRFLAFAVPLACLGHYLASPTLAGLATATLLVAGGYVAALASFALKPPLGVYVRGLVGPAAGLLPRWAQKGA